MNEEEVRNVLATSPLLADLDPTAVMFLVRLGQRRTFKKGDVLMHQGDPSTSIHFIISGTVHAERRRRTDERAVRLAVLEPGAVVGEMGVLIDIPRSATVTAVEPTETVEIDAPSFERLAKAFPILHRLLAKLLSERLRSTQDKVGETAAG